MIVLSNRLFMYEGEVPTQSGSVNGPTIPPRTGLFRGICNPWLLPTRLCDHLLRPSARNECKTKTNKNEKGRIICDEEINRERNNKLRIILALV